MNAKILTELVISSLENVKGQAITCLDVQKLTQVTDYMVIVTGTSNRHLGALADEVSQKVKAAGTKVWGCEGRNSSQWVLLDLGDVIVHIMLAATRSLYNLESFWGFDEEVIESDLLSK